MRVAILTVLVLAGCGGGAPSVEILGATPTTLDPTRDSADDLHLRVKYDDPDGDLGGGVAEVRDCRAEGLVTKLPLPAIASKAGVDAQVEIEGELDLVVADVGVLAVGSQAAKACRDLDAPAKAFCVVLVDDAGNRSDGACTGAIEVLAGE